MPKYIGLRRKGIRWEFNCDGQSTEHWKNGKSDTGNGGDVDTGKKRIDLWIQ